jgi:hypothetical protein
LLFTEPIGVFKEIVGTTSTSATGATIATNSDTNFTITEKISTKVTETLIESQATSEEHSPRLAGFRIAFCPTFTYDQTYFDFITQGQWVNGNSILYNTYAWAQ